MLSRFFRAPRRRFGDRPAAQSRRRSRPDEFIRLSLTRLEERRVLDAAGLVADLMPGIFSSDPQHFTEFAGSLYFSASGRNATGEAVGQELFRLDAEGRASLVADIYAGEADSNPDGFTRFGDALYFAATGAKGRELYRIDSSGQVSLVDDIRAGTASSDPAGFTPFDGSLYFAATGTSGRELYRLRANQSVSLVADIRAGTGSSDPDGLVEFNSKLYFAATGPNGRELFILNRGNQVNQSNDINPGAASANPAELTVFDDSLYFAATSPSGRGLYRQSSSGVNPVQVVDLTMLSDPRDFTEFDGHLYFRAENTRGGSELFQMDSSERVTAVYAADGRRLFAPTGFTRFNDSLYFGASFDDDRLLFRLDIEGAAAAAIPIPLPSYTSLLSNGPTGQGDVQPFGNYLYFVASGPSGHELYRVDANDRVVLAVDVNPGFFDSGPAEFVTFRGEFYFSAYQFFVGRELFHLIPEGSTLTIVGDDLVFQGGPGEENNRIVISTDGANLLVRDENGHAISSTIPSLVGSGTDSLVLPLTSIAGIRTFVIDTRSGVDSVTLDLSANADVLLSVFDVVAYDGGSPSIAPVGDLLRVIGDGSLRAVFTPDGLQSGKGLVAISSATQMLDVRFVDLEPVDFAGMARAELVAPATVGGVDIWTVTDGTDALDGLRAALVVAGTSGGTAIENVHFFDNALVVLDAQAGSDGADSVTVLSATGKHGNGSLAIDTGTSFDGSSDIVRIQGDVQLLGTLFVRTDVVTVADTLSAAGNVDLLAAHDVSFTAAGSIVSSLGSVRVVADRDASGKGGIAMADGSSMAAGPGTIALSAAGDVIVSRLITANATSSAISVVSTLGSVLTTDRRDDVDIVVSASAAIVTISAFGDVGTADDALDTNARNLVIASVGKQYLRAVLDIDSLRLNSAAGVYLNVLGSIRDTDSDVDVTAGQLALVAGGSIGTAGRPLEITVGKLEGEAGGAIYLTNIATALLTVGGVSDALSGLTAGGSLTLVTAGPLTIHEAVSSHGPLSVTSGGVTTVSAAIDSHGGPLGIESGGDLTVSASITSGGGPLTLLAADDFGLSGGAQITSGGGSLTVVAGGAAMLSAGTAIVAGAGPLSLSAGESATLSALSSLGLVSVTAGGSIVDGDPGGSAAIAAGQLALVAGGSIGTAGRP
ncbi:MAG: hypothetical protein WD875_12660, partial [Pirellulales bacterium]